MVENLKILDNTSGSGDIFKVGSIYFQFEIIGNANSNIKAFLTKNDQQLNDMVLKIFSADWGGAKAVLKMKTSHPEDSFSSGGNEFTKDSSTLLQNVNM